MFLAQLIAGVILIIASFVLNCGIHGGGGRKKKDPPPAISPVWFDPQAFVQLWLAGPIWIGSGTDAATAAWEHADHRKWQAQVQQLDRDGLLVGTGDKLMKWQSWDRLPDIAETRYLREYHADLAAIRGENSFLMTPYLREWQKRNMWEYVLPNTKLFDIGIGTGRSRDLWAARRLEVWGVEPNEDSVRQLERRHIPRLQVRPWGGEDARIPEFVPKVDTIMMSYSITFFFRDPARLDALVSNITATLRQGGHFILIGMDGERVDQWLNSDTLDNPLFKMTRRYKKRETFGNEIEITIKNPNTLVSAQTEYLVDFDHFRKVLAHAGLKCIVDKHVEAPGFLTDWPRKWVEAQRLLVFKSS